MLDYSIFRGVLINRLEKLNFAQSVYEKVKIAEMAFMRIYSILQDQQGKNITTQIKDEESTQRIL